MRQVPLVALFCIAVLIACTGVAFSSGPGWTYRADAAHTGVYNDGGTHPANIVKWKYQTQSELWRQGGIVYGSPAIVDGILYFGDNEGYFHARDANTGNPVWIHEIGSDGSATVTGGVVYYNNYHSIYALDAATGEQKWKFETNERVTDPAVVGGIVYLGGEDRKVYALDAKTGSVNWKQSGFSELSAAPAVIDGVLYIGDGAGRVFALDTGSGQEKWRFETYGIVTATPAVSGGLVFIGDRGGNFFALDVATGNQVWKYEFAGQYGVSSAAVADGKVYVGSSDGNVYALNAATGTLAWKYAVMTKPSQNFPVDLPQPSFASGVIYSNGGDFTGKPYTYGLYALDANNGALLWSCPTSDAVTSAPAIAGGLVFVGTRDRYVYAIGQKPSSTPKGTSASPTQAPSTSTPEAATAKAGSPTPKAGISAPSAAGQEWLLLTVIGGAMAAFASSRKT